MAMLISGSREQSEGLFDGGIGPGHVLRHVARPTEQPDVVARELRPLDERLKRVAGRRRHHPHLQARLLARHLRGDLEHYPPYLGR